MSAYSTAQVSSTCLTQSKSCRSSPSPASTGSIFGLHPDQRTLGYIRLSWIFLIDQAESRVVILGCHIRGLTFSA